MKLSKDGRTLARENEIRVLRALHRFGFLRTRDIGALVWSCWERKATGAPDLRPPVASQSALRMAQRTMRRLRDRHVVLAARGPDGSIIYSLAEAGVRTLQSIGIPATSGKDLIRTSSTGYFRHRCISNEVAISAILAGFRVSTEREIARGLWVGHENGIGGKKPDVLIRTDDAVWLVEVERSRKNARDYANLLKWLNMIIRDRFGKSIPKLLGDKMRLEKVVFISSAAFRAKLLRDLSAAGWKEIHFQTCLMFETCLYYLEAINFN